MNDMTGGSNIAWGWAAGSGVTTANNVIVIGHQAAANVSFSCFIDNIRGATKQRADAVPALIDSYGQLGTASSSWPIQDRH